jgi:hypothetical protein
LNWYRWLYDGNREWGIRQIVDMNDFAARHGIRFSVAILPAGVAYTSDGYALQKQQAEILDDLRRARIPTIDLTAALSRESFDDTDHLTERGNEEAATALATQISKELKAIQ